MTSEFDSNGSIRFETAPTGFQPMDHIAAYEAANDAYIAAYSSAADAGADAADAASAAWDAWDAASAAWDAAPATGGMPPPHPALS